jgi:hypothetical protein
VFARFTMTVKSAAAAGAATGNAAMIARIEMNRIMVTFSLPARMGGGEFAGAWWAVRK